jgi:S-adenosylmethionine:tRNA ribosyltransferase-isomerase
MYMEGPRGPLGSNCVLEEKLDPFMTSSLSLDDFDFEYPEELVAHRPLLNREDSRLLIRYSDGQLSHRKVPDLVDELTPGTVLIFNDSKVFPSRLEGYLPTGGRVELFLIRELAEGGWVALGRPLKKLTCGKKIFFPNGLEALLGERAEDCVKVTFNLSSMELSKWLDENGFIPLPPYIKRENKVRASVSPDRERYQTVYAGESGSVAAPTAGLHFTDGLFAQLKQRGVDIQFVSLHVGAGTFLPVKTSDISRHDMHQELYRVPLSTIRAILSARKEGRKVVAVGTTTLRSLEDLYRRTSRDGCDMEELADTWQTTKIFIYPRHTDDLYKPWIIDGLLTNFHQPKSTLFMLISSLVGVSTAREIYRKAFEERYRLFSYGDTSLLWL